MDQTGKQEFLDRYRAALRQVGMRPGDTVVLINSQKELGRGDVAPLEYLDILDEELPPEATLVLQTFNWDFFRGKPYHHRRSVARTGLLSEVFRRLEGVCRSPHPVYSFAARGPRAAEICRHEGDTCWGPGTPLETLVELDSLWVNLGREFPYGIELLHRFEEIGRVPYRFFKTFTGLADFGRGEAEYSTRFYARPLGLEIGYHWQCAVDRLAAKGLVRRLGEEFPLTGVRARDLEAACFHCLDQDNLCFLKDPEAFLRALAEGIEWA